MIGSGDQLTPQMGAVAIGEELLVVLEAAITDTTPWNNNTAHVRSLISNSSDSLLRFPLHDNYSTQPHTQRTYIETTKSEISILAAGVAGAASAIY